MKDYNTEEDFDQWFKLLSYSATLQKYKDWFRDYWFDVQENPNCEVPFLDGSHKEETFSCKYSSLMSLTKQSYLKEFNNHGEY